MAATLISKEESGMAKIQSISLAFAVVLAFASKCTLATITYNDEASFSEALGGTSTVIESFEEPSTDTDMTPLSFPTADIACDGSTWCSDFFGTSPLMPTDGSQGVYFATPDSITFTFSSPITAFAVDIGDLGTRGATDLSVTLSNGNSTTLLTEYTGSSYSQTFIGLIDDVEFTTITFHGTVADDGIYFDRMQTAVVAAPVPEPEASAMVITGLAVLGLFAYRRKR